MQLHEIPKGSKIICNEGTITFHHLDGMYSYCTADWIDSENNVINLSRFTPIEVRDNKYHIKYD